MSQPAYITTSWDDGHPLDLRVAELLAKHGVKATFYAPRVSQRPTMPPSEVAGLSTDFEMGAHTLNHVVLTRVDPQAARREIADSKAWIEQVTGRPCAMFCPPLGRFASAHMAMMRETGFIGMRTVELLSLDRPRRREGLMEMPTTIQAHPHGMWSYGKNAVRRRALGNLWLYVRCGGWRDWLRFARRILDDVMERGGVFHLWGHSWELEEDAQWQRLEDILRMVGDCGTRAALLTNGEICKSV